MGESLFKKQCLTMFERSSITSSIMTECKNDGCAPEKCESDACATDLQLYNALHDYALDYAHDEIGAGKHDANKPHKDLALLEKEFCDRVREEVIANAKEKAHLCKFIGACKSRFGASGDNEHLCSSSSR